MAFRMKRSGAGLASVCILATMVLVMISSTTCLYFGEEDAINARYPNDFQLAFELTGEGLSNVEDLRKELLDAANPFGVGAEDLRDYAWISFVGGYKDGNILTERKAAEETNALCTVRLIPLADYNRVTGESETLQDGEALLCLRYGAKVDTDTLRFDGGNGFKVIKEVERFAGEGTGITAIPEIVLFVTDAEKTAASLGLSELYRSYVCTFDTELDGERQTELLRTLWARFKGENAEIIGYASCIIISKAVERDDFYGTFGGLFYLGILLSAVFICAAVLILYYKQITEASEDRARFAIMQKVGMTAREIRSSVNSQMLTVFYLPLLLAGVHLAFAFPMIRKLLSLFALNNVALFATTTLISFAVFALLYTLVYRVTAGAYCDIVGGEREA